MASHLTIRNLTSTAIEIKVVERYVPPAEQASSSSLSSSSSSSSNKAFAIFGNVTATVSDFVRNSPAPSSAAIAEGVQAFTSQDVSIRVGPLCVCVTEVDPANVTAKESVRLTFEAEGGERFRVDTTPSSLTQTQTRTHASTEAVPLTPNPSFRYTAVYLAQHALLTLFSSANLGSWMREFHDETPLSALSIPGTHNSATCHRALPSVRCQAVGVTEQLDNGVRFLDVRVQPDDAANPAKDTLMLVHGVFPISLTGFKYFRDLVNEVTAFLDRNPSEAVIMSVKREGPGEHTDAQLSRRLRDHYAGDVGRWFTAPRIPTLGEARRKIVLIRRFALDDSLKSECDGQGWCINAEAWAYNTPHDTCPSGRVCVQDFCEVMESENIDQKIGYAQQGLNRTACCVCAVPIASPSTTTITTTTSNDQTPTEQSTPPPPPSPPPPFYLNFLSASNFWRTDCWPEKIAAKLNPAILEYLCRRHNQPDALVAVDGERRDPGHGSTGVVILDWVGHRGDWDIVRCIVGWNVRLEMREKGRVGE